MNPLGKPNLVAIVLLLAIGVVSCFDVLTENSQVTTDAEPNSLHIGSFNIQIFGLKKLENQEVENTLLRIVSRYDVCLIQEIRDKTESAIFAFVDKLNAYNTHRKYKVSVSVRLGRTNSKEQYGFVYDSKRVKLEATYQFNDTKNWFERPPYSALVRPIELSSKASLMWLTGVHIKPSAAATEIAHMIDVYDSYIDDRRIPALHKAALRDRLIMMGDFNAGCSYLSKKETSRLKTLTPRPSPKNGISTPQPFVWLVCTYEK